MGTSLKAKRFHLVVLQELALHLLERLLLALLLVSLEPLEVGRRSRFEDVTGRGAIQMINRLVLVVAMMIMLRVPQFDARLGAKFGSDRFRGHKRR